MRSIPQLSKQYRETIKEIEEIRGVDKEDDEIGEILTARKAVGSQTPSVRVAPNCTYTDGADAVKVLAVGKLFVIRGRAKSLMTGWDGTEEVYGQLRRVGYRFLDRMVRRWTLPAGLLQE